MKIECRRDLRHRYLVIRPDADTVFGYRAGMILNNQLEHFTRCFSEELNGRKIFYEEIPSGYFALSAYLEQNGATEAFYRCLLRSLSEAMQELSEYLLDPSEILLEPEYIFLDDREKTIIFVYYPQTELSFAQKCIGLSEALLHKIRNEEQGAVEIGYMFYRYCVKENITSESLNDMARNPVPDKAWTASKPARTQPESVQTIPGAQPDLQDAEDMSFLFAPQSGKTALKEGRRTLRDLFRHKKRKKDKPKKGKEIPEREEEMLYGAPEENAGEADSFLFADHRPETEAETVLLKPERDSVRAWLVPEDMSAQEKIPLEKDRILIGKSVAGADLLLDSAAVSRIHARISWETDAYGIADLGSRNGTAVNGIPIRPGEWIRLKEGDALCFADCRFLYCTRG